LREVTARVAISQTNDQNQGMADSLSKLIEERSLPTAFRGYDRAATDDFLAKLEAALKEALSERSDAHARIAELEKHIAEGRQQEEAITEALVEAARVRSDSEREAKEIKARATRESEFVKSEGNSKADETLRAAEAKAEKILEDARLKARVYEQDIRNAGQLAQQTRARITSFLESLLDEVNSSHANLASAVDDLLVRVNDAAKVDRDPMDAQATPSSQAGSGA
jgi:cell division initiation protein